MLEILYDETTNRVRGWCADPNQFGNFTPKPDQVVATWDIPIPPRSDWYEVDLVNKVIIPNPDYIPPAPVIFDPTNPALGVEHRLTHVEDFLQGLYPPS